MSIFESPTSRAAVKPDQEGLCRVFVSYAHVDEAARARLQAHLAPLVREGRVEFWCNQFVAPGADWESAIESELTSADIVILLVTADFVSSVYCVEKELAEALRRHERSGTRILPVVVKPVDFASLPFARFQALPRNLRPIDTWDSVDEAWAQVAVGVREMVEDVYRSRSEIPVPRKGGDKTRLGRELDDYYGPNNCVVDGPNSVIEWIPLNEDAESMHFDNLVPLSRRHRLRSLRFMPGALQRATFRFGIDLNSENLFHQARRHFHDGRAALAFGCARLGEVLAVHYPYDFEAHEGDDWAFLAQSLLYLPYRAHPALLDATLHRVRGRLTAHADYPAAARAALLLAVANLHQDAGAWTQAERLYDEILLSGPSSSLGIAAFRRRAVGRLFSGANHDEMDRDFRSISEWRTNADLSVSLAMSQGWWHLTQGRPEQCLSQLEKFDLDERVSTYSPPRAIELKLTLASALDELGVDWTPHLEYVREQVRYRTGGLRPVFTDHVAPLLLSANLEDVIAPLRLSAPPPTDALASTALVLLATKGTTIPTRPLWLD